MLKLIITLTIITILIIRSVLSLNSANLCYSITDSECKGNFSYQCGKDMCSLNKEICNKYNFTYDELVHRVSNYFKTK